MLRGRQGSQLKLTYLFLRDLRPLAVRERRFPFLVLRRRPPLGASFGVSVTRLSPGTISSIRTLYGGRIMISYSPSSSPNVIIRTPGFTLIFNIQHPFLPYVANPNATIGLYDVDQTNLPVISSVASSSMPIPRYTLISRVSLGALAIILIKRRRCFLQTSFSSGGSSLYTIQFRTSVCPAPL